MVYDWHEELRKQRAAEEADQKRHRESRERTTETAKNWIRAGNVDAAMALYGIEPSRRNEDAVSGDLESIELQLQDAIRSKINLFDSGTPLSDAYREAILVAQNRLNSIVVTELSADGELNRLGRDFQWLFDGPLDNAKRPFEVLVEQVTGQCSLARTRMLERAMTREPSDDQRPWQPVKLSADDWQTMRELREREDNERQEAARLRAKVNEARAYIGEAPL